MFCKEGKNLTQTPGLEALTASTYVQPRSTMIVSRRTGATFAEALTLATKLGRSLGMLLSWAKFLEVPLLLNVPARRRALRSVSVSFHAPTSIDIR